ncbi:MAG: glycerophosphodiester phosphodiesterase family protein [Chloroflexota bacterium]|nr:glycerophosphodiester phosphodiesterase family protein [Chloroflexota bacterium]
MSLAPARSRPRIVGHRGAKGLAPENTLAAFRVAIEVGADGVELDVQRSSDGHLLVFHDDDLQRITGVPGKLVEWPLARLKELDAGSHFGPQFAGEPIPTLDEVIASLPRDCWINIEAKRSTWASDGLENAIVDVVRNWNLYERTVISSFNPAALWRIARMDHQIPLGLLYAPHMPLWLGTAWPRHFLRLQDLHPHFSQVTPDLVQQARQAGQAVNTWTVNEPAEMQAMVDLGVDGIITDQPAGVLMSIFQDVKKSKCES